LKYAFIKAHRSLFSIAAMCRVLGVQRSGFYAWLKQPLSKLAKDNIRLTGLIKQAWLESGCVYGYRKTRADLRSLGESCSPGRVARLAKAADIKAQIGYKRRPRIVGGVPAIIAKNKLQQNFCIDMPDTIWVTDIIYSRFALFLHSGASDVT
jgi:putative transposase